MSKRRHRPAPGAPSAEETGGTTVRLVVESVLWIWALSVIGYFYYSRNFHILLQKAWEQGFG